MGLLRIDCTQTLVYSPPTRALRGDTKYGTGIKIIALAVAGTPSAAAIYSNSPTEVNRIESYARSTTAAEETPATDLSLCGGL